METGKTNLKNKQTSVKQMHSLIPTNKLTAKRPLEQTLPRTRPLRMWSPNFVPNTLGGHSNLELLTFSNTKRHKDAEKDTDTYEDDTLRQRRKRRQSGS